MLLAGWLCSPEEVSAWPRGREGKTRHAKLVEKGCVLVKRILSVLELWKAVW